MANGNRGILRDGRHYDAEFHAKDNDIEFYCNIGARRGKMRILELGVGTGRVAIPLALQGHDVSGIDISQSMLNLAKEKSQERGVRLTLIKGDISNLKINGAFDLIISPFNTLMHLSRKELGFLLSEVSSALSSGGLFVVDVGNPAKYSTENGERKLYSAQYKDPNGEGVIFITTELELQDDKLCFTRFFRLQNGALLSEEALTMNFFPIEEWREMLQASGLQIQEVFGDHSGSSYSRSSRSLIMICRRD